MKSAFKAGLSQKLKKSTTSYSMAHKKPKAYCEGCKKKPTIHLTEIINGKVTEIHLCEDCPKLLEMQSEKQFGLADLLAGLAGFGQSVEQPKETTIKCEHCGMTYDEFRKFGRLGCSECYRYFQSNLSTLLKNIHGSNQHLGKAPVLVPDVQKKKLETLHDLKNELIKAIECEDFEKAAILRDKIRGFEKDNI